MSSRAPKSTRDQIVPRTRAGLSNKKNSSTAARLQKNNLQCTETVQGDWEDLQQANYRQKAFWLNKGGS